MNDIIEAYGDSFVYIIGICAVFMLLLGCLTQYRAVLTDMLNSCLATA